MATFWAEARSSRERQNMVAATIIPPFRPSLDMKRPPTWPPVREQVSVRCEENVSYQAAPRRASDSPPSWSPVHSDWTRPQTEPPWGAARPGWTILCRFPWWGYRESPRRQQSTAEHLCEESRACWPRTPYCLQHERRERPHGAQLTYCNIRRTRNLILGIASHFSRSDRPGVTVCTSYWGGSFL